MWNKSGNGRLKNAQELVGLGFLLSSKLPVELPAKDEPVEYAGSGLNGSRKTGCRRHILFGFVEQIAPHSFHPVVVFRDFRQILLIDAPLLALDIVSEILIGLRVI